MEGVSGETERLVNAEVMSLIFAALILFLHGDKVHFTFPPAEAINESSDHNMFAIRRPCCWRCIGGTLYAHNGIPEFNLYTSINSIIL